MVETCSSVIICEIIVHLLVTEQNKVHRHRYVCESIDVSVRPHQDHILPPGTCLEILNPKLIYSHTVF